MEHLKTINNMNQFNSMTNNELSFVNGGMIVVPFTWFKSLPQPKGKLPTGLLIL
ncbi:TPA: ComC/BlpC family leader-containing pheromone/bacteriocin [Streptococcus suis]|nr:ComC/BlpC family leader-containing pheromone/bacteriocin [Streptococcus suis]HEM4698186.1 ComC/BlpC family leader-containing pheromone/bacteriocin [Streptococcus suis]HEM4702134.1 ComC/BlpC family leader-containing pheromone/bacteriocin [Streptococcus suis]HEM4702327.1 ComC/BlpC family leader-containing pheromone/bacteriocin [Streptococcus suis]HEM4718892.1 ComC/BlpC family leader-containing pheromone/bacteriocin [Streptococcus suis]